MSTVSRSATFLVAGAAAAAACCWPAACGERPRRGAAAQRATAAPPAFAPNAFVRIGTDGAVTLIMPQVGDGAGHLHRRCRCCSPRSWRSIWTRSQVEHAPPDDKLYANPLIGFQATGGSTSVRGFCEPLRQAGATARTMLVAAAAADAGTSIPRRCRAEKGTVIHAATGRTLGYGALADAAAKLPVPEQVALKDPKDFKLIGTPAKRLDTPAKVNGTAQFGIDVRLPGMKIATVAAARCSAASSRRSTTARRMAIKGVRQVVRLDEPVAVVADHMWAAKQGLAALGDPLGRRRRTPSSARPTSSRELDAASRKPGVVGAQGGRRRRRMRRAAANKVEARVRAAVPRARHHGADELHGPRAEGWLRGVDRLTGAMSAPRRPRPRSPVFRSRRCVVHNHLLGGGFGRRLEHRLCHPGGPRSRSRSKAR